jgi:HlyD family secretion protein
MAMDVKRDPAILKRKRLLRLAILGAVGVLAAVVSLWAYRLQPAAPSVDPKTVWIEAVKQGSIDRQVRGSGTLTPEDIRWIPATTSGKVENIVLKPGAKVEPNSVIVELSNPDLQQSVKAAELAWKSSAAQFENQKATIKTNRLNQESSVADAQSQYDFAMVDLNANKTLAEQLIVGSLTIKQKQAAVDQSKNKLDVAQKQLALAIETEKSQLAPFEADVNVKRADYELKLSQLDQLKVRAGMSGVLQVVPVERGQQLAAGTNVARVANPSVLKAELQISETQTKDIAIGQSAEIDTRNGIVKGHVVRIDPAAKGGTVGVDVTLDGALPAGARADQSVDGTIELERLNNVVYTGHATFAAENATVTLFRLTPAGDEAVRVKVTFGRSSVNTIEVKAGLKPGDQVILSDMSQYDGFDRIRLK